MNELPSMIGPQIPQGFLANQSDSDDTYGPLPCAPGQDTESTSVAEDFARRADRMKDKLLIGVRNNRVCASSENM